MIWCGLINYDNIIEFHSVNVLWIQVYIPKEGNDLMWINYNIMELHSVNVFIGTSLNSHKRQSLDENQIYMIIYTILYDNGTPLSEIFTCRQKSTCKSMIWVSENLLQQKMKWSSTQWILYRHKSRFWKEGKWFDDKQLHVTELINKQESSTQWMFYRHKSNFWIKGPSG